MKTSAQSFLLTSLGATTLMILTGCSSAPNLQNTNLDLNPAVTAQVAEAQPSYVVGDELGLMMFSQVALAPEASPTYDVHAIAAASPAPHAPSFDWIQNYLALTR